MENKHIPYERLEEIAFDCIRYIGIDNDDMTDALNALGLSSDELRLLGCFDFAELVD